MDQDANWYSEVDLGSGHIVLDGDPAPPPKKKRHSPHFLSYVYCDQTAGWIRMPLGTDVGTGPGHTVLDGDPDPPPKKVAQPRIFGSCLS